MTEQRESPLPEVDTTAGRVRGTSQRGIATFLGIPYAVPAARFGEPTAPAPWSNALDASRFGPPPPQSGLLGRPADAASATDCLTVNVWTADPGGALPVLVWVQGGGYLFGTSGLPEYDGAQLASGGVVLVTFNYRVGAEGFALVDGAPANRGLLDQVAALEWVRDNIAAFGGDPERVTVFGQSAGGGCVAALLAMPTAVGLFGRAIVQSMPGVFLTPALAADVARVLAAELGVRPQELRTVDPDDLTAAVDLLVESMDSRADRWGAVAHRRIPMAPVVDGSTLPTDPWRALAAGASTDVDLVVGHVRDENRLFAFMDGVLGRVSEGQAADVLARFAPPPDGAGAYRALGLGPDLTYDLVHSDWLFRMPSLHLGEAHRGRTFAYELTWSAPAFGGVLGSCHGLDVPLVFGNLDAGQPAALLGDDLTEAEIMSAQLRHAWTSFATYGTPGWPPYDPPQRLTRIFDVVPAVVPYPEETSRRIWAGHHFAPADLPVGVASSRPAAQPTSPPPGLPEPSQSPSA